MIRHRTTSCGQPCIPERILSGGSDKNGSGIDPHFRPCLIAIMCIVVSYLPFLMQEWAQNDLSNMQKVIFYLRPTLTILAPAIVTGIGFILICKATAAYLRSMHSLPYDYKLGSIILRRLLGIPPIPPPLNQVLKYPFIVLRDAALEDNHWARLIGGPATLVVYDGLAVYLERGNQFSRVVGPGMPFLERYERVKEVIDVKPQMKTGYVKPWTKDGIRITLTLMVSARSLPALKPEQKSRDYQYPFDPLAVQSAVEHMTVKENDGELRQAAWLEGAGVPLPARSMPMWPVIRSTNCFWRLQHQLPTRLHTPG